MDDAVACIAVRRDGTIIIGGNFTLLDVYALKYVALLTREGYPDQGYFPSVNGPVAAMAAQGDGAMIIGGEFTTLGGTPHARIARINDAGNADASFTASTDGPVTSTAIQPDGKIIIAGDFSTVNGQPRPRLARLNPDGTLDTEFTAAPPGGVSPHIHSMAVQTDGKIVVAGGFTDIGGTVRNRIARLHPDGTLERDSIPMPTTPSSAWRCRRMVKFARAGRSLPPAENCAAAWCGPGVQSKS